MSYTLKKWQIISKKFKNLTLPLGRPIEQGKIRRQRGCDEKERYETPSNIHRNKRYNHSIIQNAMPYRMQWKWYESIQLASSPYYHKSIEKAREMIQAHIAQRVFHDDDVAPVGWTDWYSVGKSEVCAPGI